MWALYSRPRHVCQGAKVDRGINPMLRKLQLKILRDFSDRIIVPQCLRLDVLLNVLTPSYGHAGIDGVRDYQALEVVCSQCVCDSLTECGSLAILGAGFWCLHGRFPSGFLTAGGPGAGSHLLLLRKAADFGAGSRRRDFLGRFPPCPGVGGCVG